MHNLAIALARKGYQVTGSDDEIFEPSKSRLQRDGILPKQFGWDINNIHINLDAVIVGMHAREDNPELLQAKSLNIPIFSYPEYLYEQSKDKKRIVIGGSHGKTTITSMAINSRTSCPNKETTICLLHQCQHLHPSNNKSVFTNQNNSNLTLLHKTKKNPKSKVLLRAEPVPLP